MPQCLGKLPAKRSTKNFMFRAFAVALEAPPIACQWEWKLKAPGDLGNQIYGDCAFAGAMHNSQCWTANTGTECKIAEAAVIKAYLGDA